MTREIKFRAYGKGYQEEEVKMRYSNDSPDLPCFWTLYIGQTRRPTYAEAVMQFTGLLDKNGKEIYEGDILKYANPFYPNREQPLHIVEWHKNGSFLLKLSNGEFSGMDGIIQRNERWEVIGNIYENPVLLK